MGQRQIFLFNTVSKPTLGLTYLSFRAKIKNVWKLPPLPHASWSGPSLGMGTDHGWIIF